MPVARALAEAGFNDHFHLSLQSGCDSVLKAMNRHYTVEDYLALIDKINEKYELPFIGSDIIAGFAGETEEDFEITKANLIKSGLSQIHTFPYSIRKGTVGASAENQVSEDEKNRRTEIIKEISKEKYLSFVNRNIGQVQEILIEKHPDKKTGMLKGITRNYLTVILNSDDLSLTNTLQTVKLKKYSEGKIYAEL